MDESRFSIKLGQRGYEYGHRKNESSTATIRRDCMPTVRVMAVSSSARRYATKPADAAEIVQRDLRIRQLERELEHARANSSQIAIDILGEAVKLTTGLFGKSVGIKESFDPEFPADKYIVLTVNTSLGSTQIVKAEQAWITEIRKIAPNWDSLRLLIRPR
jgi:hypothetical protein